MTRRSSSTCASGTIVRISAMEIIGRKRKNRNSSARNRPIVPTKVPQSQIVGEYMPHDEGRKSRCRLVTTMTKRSSHMPTLTISEMTNSTGTLVRIFLNHSACGIAMLQRISAQYDHQYGPVERLTGTNHSNLSALYQATNASVR